MRIKKHIEFERLDGKTINVESVESLFKKGVLTNDDIREFNCLDILPHQCCHTSVMAAVLGDGIESVQGKFGDGYPAFHCINRKKDSNGKWRYFDLTDWKLNLGHKKFIQERAFTRQNARDCFMYYRNSFNTSFPSIGNFYYDDNGNIKTIFENQKPKMYSEALLLCD